MFILMYMLQGTQKKKKYLPYQKDLLFLSILSICVLNCRRFRFDWNKILVFIEYEVFILIAFIILCRGSLKDVGNHSLQ